VGWARADVADDGTWTDLRHGITPLRDMALAVHTATAYGEVAGYTSDYDVVVMEDWRLYPDKVREFSGSTFPSVQFIGMVRLCCWLSGTSLVMQGARVKTTTDKTMPALRPDLYKMVTVPRKHDDSHDMDAIRHLWHWTFKNTDCRRIEPSTEGVTA